jgi:hypothetical protein
MDNYSGKFVYGIRADKHIKNKETPLALREVILYLIQFPYPYHSIC